MRQTLHRFLFLMAASLAACSVCNAETVAVRDLPEPVRKSLTAVSRGDPVKEVTRETVDGKVVYHIELERNNAINPRLRIAEDGTVLQGSRADLAATRDGAPVVGTPYAPYGVNPVGSDPFNVMLAMDEVPAPVRRTIEEQAQGREIADLDRETWEDREVYEVEFAEAGFNERIHVGSDGRIVDNEPIGEQVADWFRGTQIEDTPTAVQETIRRETRGRRVVDIDQEVRTGDPIYEVEVRDADGDFQLHIAADGSIVRDDRAGQAAE